MQHINKFPGDDQLTPVTIVVGDGRWDAIDKPTPRNIWLTQILTAMGGVNESVPSGTHHFNVLEVDGQFVVSLTPAPNSLK